MYNSQMGTKIKEDQEKLSRHCISKYRKKKEKERAHKVLKKEFICDKNR